MGWFGDCLGAPCFKNGRTGSTSWRAAQRGARTLASWPPSRLPSRPLAARTRETGLRGCAVWRRTPLQALAGIWCAARACCRQVAAATSPQRAKTRSHQRFPDRLRLQEAAGHSSGGSWADSAPCRQCTVVVRGYRGNQCPLPTGLQGAQKCCKDGWNSGMQPGALAGPQNNQHAAPWNGWSLGGRQRRHGGPGRRAEGAARSSPGPSLAARLLLHHRRHLALRLARQLAKAQAHARRVLHELVAARLHALQEDRRGAAAGGQAG